jgi:CBS-domain-containing membrane protein
MVPPVQPPDELTEKRKEMVEKDLHGSFLSKLKLGDFISREGRELITMDNTQTVGQALTLLREKKILSIPIVDKKDDQKILGILNMTDLCNAIAFQQCFDQFKGEPQKLQDIQKPEFEKLIKTSLFTTPVVDLLAVSEESKRIWEADEDTRMEKIMEMFSKGIHRIICRMHNGKRFMVSQWDIVRYLKDHEEHLGPIMEMPINRLGLCPAQLTQRGTHPCDRHYEEHQEGKGLITMTMDDTALSGFQKLYNHGWEIHALPILDKSGDIVATLSASDLRGMNESTFGLLLLPVLDFLHEMTGGQPHPTITVRPNSTMSELMKKITFARVNRVWVMDHYKIVGPHVVTLTDIIRTFSPYDWDKLRQM